LTKYTKFGLVRQRKERRVRRKVVERRRRLLILLTQPESKRLLKNGRTNL